MLLLPFIALSQSNFKPIKINGIVMDSLTQKSMPFATISLFKMPVETVYKRLAGDADGSFSMAIKDTGNYKLMVQMTGYAPFIQLFEVNDSTRNMDFGKLIIAEAAQTLGEVSIIADKPLIKVDADKITYSAEADPESKTSNVLDMMRKVPLLTVDGDDNIQLKGASNFKIFINGKPSTMLNNNSKDVLKSMPASTIKDIEVITSPGAKYDAEGIGGIINIVTVKKSINGYNCSINAGAGSRGDANSSIYFASTVGKFAFSTNMSVYYYNPPKSNNSMFRENYNVDDFKYTYYDGSTSYKGLSPWGNAELSYEIDTLNLISATVSLWYGKPEGLSLTNVNIYDAGNTLMQSYQMKNSFANEYGSPDGNIDYQHIFKKNKEQIFTLSYKFSQSPDNNSGETEYVPILNYYKFLRQSSTEASRLEQTFQADYVQPLNKKNLLELGVKYILRGNNSFSQYKVFDYDLNDFVSEMKDNNFDYTQKIMAAYSSVNFKFKKISLKTGVRMEKSLTDGNISSQDTSFTNKSLEFVPTFNLSYQLTPTQNLKLSYNMRIQRPDIWYLNPYVDKLDSKNISYGNPNLNPERFHSVDLNYGNFGKKSNINLSLFYSFSNNSIEGYSWIKDTVTYRTYYNLGKVWSAGLSAYGSIRFGTKFSINMGGSARYTDIQSNLNDALKSNGWGGNVNSSLRYSFKKGYKLSAYGGMYYRGVSLQSKSSPYYYSGFSANKSFYKDKMTISLSARNPFTKNMKYVNETRDTNFYIRNENFYIGRSFSINFSFRFGEMKGEVKKSRRSINNDDVKAGSGGNSGGGEGGGK